MLIILIKLKNILFEGVCVNYRHPGPRRGEPRVDSAGRVAFPVESSRSGSEFREAQQVSTVQ